MTDIHRADIRFNLKKDADYRAWMVLNDSGLSHSKTVITALNAYAALKSEQERQEEFLKQIQETIRDALESCGTHVGFSSLPEEEHDEDRVSPFDFLDQLEEMG